MIDKELEYIQKGLKTRITIDQLDSTLVKINNLIIGKKLNTKSQTRLDNIIDSILERKTNILNRSKELEINLVSTINSSKGEELIQEVLIRKGVIFTREQEFDGLINRNTGYRLRFDFYLPDLRACIEFNGRQHFEYSEEFDKGDITKLVQRKFRDGLKNKFCNQKGLILLRINYKDYNNISSILNKFISRYTIVPVKSNWYKVR